VVVADRYTLDPAFEYVRYNGMARFMVRDDGAFVASRHGDYRAPTRLALRLGRSCFAPLLFAQCLNCVEGRPQVHVHERDRRLVDYLRVKGKAWSTTPLGQRLYFHSPVHEIFHWH
jgi:hypothetical protein